MLWAKKENVAGARFRQPDSAPTTKPSQSDEPRRLRFDDCCHEGCNQSVAQDRSLASPDFIRTRSNLVLNAAANMQGRDAAAQIFKLDTLKSCCTHHATKFFLIRKLRNRIR